jgi:hypothetical protein
MTHVSKFLSTASQAAKASLHLDPMRKEKVNTHLVWEFPYTRTTKLLHHPAQVGRIVKCRVDHGDDAARFWDSHE